MSCDYAFMKLSKARERTYPLGCDDYEMDECLGDFPWDQFCEWFEQTYEGAEIGVTGIDISYADGGSASFMFNNDMITMFSYAGLRRTLNALKFLESIDEDIVVFDMQSGDTHNSSSFLEYMKENGVETE